MVWSWCWELKNIKGYDNKGLGDGRDDSRCVVMNMAMNDGVNGYDNGRLGNDNKCNNNKCI